MALTATIDATQTPPTLTVVSDKRKFSGTVTAAGETAEFAGLWPITVTDSSGKSWVVVSDDGTTAVYD